MNHLYDLNLDQISRDEIIGISFIADQPSGGIRDFKHLSIQQLQQLIDYRFTAECEGAETGPTITEFLAFADQFQQQCPTINKLKASLYQAFMFYFALCDSFPSLRPITVSSVL